jgi:transketolase
MALHDDIEQLAINTIRTLSIDEVQKANSGHPGMPMGAATMGYILWTRHLRHNPKNPAWPDRDRFVLSAGHASMFLYSMLFLTGYDLNMEDIKQFRQWGSRTPGHPEHESTPGVEVTTGPLGQGLANGVGMAIAERWLAATFNRQGDKIVDHYTYVLASDGDMMEGVAAEAASLAGNFRLDRLIVPYDANLITLSATTNITFSEDVAARFGAYGWHVQRIDGQDSGAVDAALTAARAVEDRPSLIVGRTHIGYGSPHKQDTWHAHGEPLVAAHPDLAQCFAQTLTGELPDGWQTHLPAFMPADGEMATRDAAGKVINALAAVVPNLVGGSGDLDPSTRTAMNGCGDFECPSVDESGNGLPTEGTAGGVWGYAGRNIHFGLREHAMAAIMTWHGAPWRAPAVWRHIPVVF